MNAKNLKIFRRIRYGMAGAVLLVSFLGEAGSIKATDYAEDSEALHEESNIVQESEVIGTSETGGEIGELGIVMPEDLEVEEPVPDEAAIDTEDSAEPELNTDVSNDTEQVETETNTDTTENEDTVSNAVVSEQTETAPEEVPIEEEPVVNENTGEIYTAIVETKLPDETSVSTGDMLTGFVETTAPEKNDGGEFLTGFVETTEPEQQAIYDEAIGYSEIPDDSEYILPVRASDVVSMVMPVIPEEMFNFTLDPLRLLSDYGIESEKYDGSTLYFRGIGDTGYTDTSAAAVAKNKSSVPVLMYVSIQVENPYGWDIDYRNMENVNEGDDAGIGFSIVPVTVSGENQIFNTGKEISIDENGHADMILYLPGTKENFDEVGGNLIEKADAQWFSAGFAIRGGCNGNADWTDIYSRSGAGEALTLRISYSMATLSESQEAAIATGDYSLDGETLVIEF